MLLISFFPITTWTCYCRLSTECEAHGQTSLQQHNGGLFHAEPQNITLGLCDTPNPLAWTLNIYFYGCVLCFPLRDRMLLVTVLLWVLTFISWGQCMKSTSNPGHVVGFLFVPFLLTAPHGGWMCRLSKVTQSVEMSDNQLALKKTVSSSSCFSFAWLQLHNYGSLMVFPQANTEQAITAI